MIDDEYISDVWNFRTTPPPQRALFCQEEEDGTRPDIYGTFQERVALPAAPRNGFPEAADATSRP